MDHAHGYGEDPAIYIAGSSLSVRIYVVCQLVLMTYEDSAEERAAIAGVGMIELRQSDQSIFVPVDQRTDGYNGDSLENCYLFAKEIIEQIRGSFKGSLWIRLSLTAYDDSEKQNSLDDWKTIGKLLEKDGIDCIDVSTGGLLDKKPNIPIRPGYQVPYTTAMKEAVSIPVSAVGLLDNPGLCEHILQTNQADLILQGRALIRNINWLADAAEELRDTNFEVYNHSYQRG